MIPYDNPIPYEADDYYDDRTDDQVKINGLKQTINSLNAQLLEKEQIIDQLSEKAWRLCDCIEGGPNAPVDTLTDDRKAILIDLEQFILSLEEGQG